MATGFIRNESGALYIINNEGKLRSLSLPEWEAYAAQGYEYYQSTQAEINGLIATNGQWVLTP